MGLNFSLHGRKEIISPHFEIMYMVMIKTFNETENIVSKEILTLPTNNILAGPCYAVTGKSNL